MTKTLLASAVAGTMLAGGALVWAQEGGDDDSKNGAAKYAIKQVMEQAHKEGLLTKVVDGQASADEKALLLDLYLSLLENDPPKGDAQAFHAKAAEAVVAAARVVVGRDGAEAEIKKAVNCAACHREHKPPAE